MTGRNDVSSINNVTSASASSMQGAKSAGDMEMSDFINLLITQLQYQNPLEPMKNEELMAQMTQIRSLEATNELTERLGTLSDGMELGSAAGLIGKAVYGKAENGQVVSGEAIGLVKENGVVSLVVEGYPPLPVGNVEEVVNAGGAANGS
jgi:flagellar basal-body rod modification protein FlgD